MIQMATGNTTKKKQELTPYQKEQFEALKKIQEYKLAAEASTVAIIYKNPELITEIDLSINEFSNNCWRVYYAIAYGILITEKKVTITDVDIGFYLEKHSQLKQKYEEYGGYDTITSAGEYINVENLPAYVDEIKKWNAIIKLAKYGFPVSEKLKEFVDCSVEEIYQEYEILLNDTFVNVDSKVKSYNGFEGMADLIERLDRGEGVGVPFSNCEFLNEEIGGMMPGEIIGIGAATGTGKSTLTINYIFPSMVKYNLKALFIINEENQDKFKQEALIWYLSNIKKSPIPKHVLRKGGFTKEVKDALLEAAKWFEEQKENRNITIIPLETYTSAIVCKLLRKYISLGVNVIVVDTLKESADARRDETWKAMMRDTVDFYNIIKKSKASLVMTYQLVKNKSRYLTNADINASKGIIDVFAVNLFFRRPLQDEYDGGKNALKCFKPISNSKIGFKLKEGEHYMICFISKNRHGNSDVQIVSKADFSVNTYEDLGYCMVTQDYNL